jgi:hypothetical protein
MSVILECQPGDEFVCIQEFHASPDGEAFSWDTSRQFRVGEQLRFRGFRQDPNFKDRPNSWNVLFETADGKCYAATQTYFVTTECWQGIKRYFAQRLLKEPRRKRVPPG